MCRGHAHVTNPAFLSCLLRVAPFTGPALPLTPLIMALAGSLVAASDAGYWFGTNVASESLVVLLG